MKRLAHLNIGIMITLIAVSYITYYFLLNDSFLHISIADIINDSHQLKSQKHLLVLGLLPIYIGSMVFGSAIFGIYLGSVMQRMILPKNNHHPFRCKTQADR